MSWEYPDMVAVGARTDTAQAGGSEEGIAYVAMADRRPYSVAPTLRAAQTEAVDAERRYERTPSELRWNRQRTEWLLLRRRGGSDWQQTGFWVAEVPSVSDGGGV